MPPAPAPGGLRSMVRLPAWITVSVTLCGCPCLFNGVRATACVVNDGCGNALVVWAAICHVTGHSKVGVCHPRPYVLKCSSGIGVALPFACG